MEDTDALEKPLEVTKSYRVGACLVPVEIMEQALQIPPANSIVGAEWDWGTKSLRLVIEGPQMPERAVGEYPAYVGLCINERIEKTIADDGSEEIKRIYDWTFKV